MQPRALKHLMQVPAADRFDVIAEGLQLLVEHVAALHDDLAHLAETNRPRSAGLVEALSEEESAKVLILLDLVRMGWTDNTAATAQIKRFYEHLARCIYAEVCHTCPQDFAEVRKIVEHLRQSRYLDGPNDVDWIFRNRLLARREEGLYVDYVVREDGPAWVTPAWYDDRLRNGHLAAVQELVLAMHRLGVTSRRGLDIIANIWSGQTIDDATNWGTVYDLNEQILTKLTEEALVQPDATEKDVRNVRDRWNFPLFGLNLREVEVPTADLEAERDRWLAVQGGW